MWKKNPSLFPLKISQILFWVSRSHRFVFFEEALRRWAKDLVSSPTLAKRPEVFSPPSFLLLSIRLFLFESDTYRPFDFHFRSPDEGLYLRSEIHCFHLQSSWRSKDFRTFDIWPFFSCWEPVCLNMFIIYRM